MFPCSSVPVGIMVAVFSQGAAKDLLYASSCSLSAPVKVNAVAVSPAGMPTVVVRPPANLRAPTFCNSGLLLAISLIALCKVFIPFLNTSAGKAVKLPTTGT